MLLCCHPSLFLTFLAPLTAALGLEPGRFMTPHCLLVLHMWLVINRLHGEPDQRRAKIFRDVRI